jgi:hypothetical protein
LLTDKAEGSDDSLVLLVLYDTLSSLCNVQSLRESVNHDGYDQDTEEDCKLTRQVFSIADFIDAVLLENFKIGHLIFQNGNANVIFRAARVAEKIADHYDSYCCSDIDLNSLAPRAFFDHCMCLASKEKNFSFEV